MSAGTLLRGSGGETFAAFELTTDEIEDATRPPLDLALVIDRSGSMSGRIEHAQSAAVGIIEHLGEQDHVALVQYDDSADVVVASTAMDAQGQGRACAARSAASRSAAARTCTAASCSAATEVAARLRAGPGQPRDPALRRPSERRRRRSAADRGDSARCGEPRHAHHDRRYRPRLQRRPDGSDRGVGSRQLSLRQGGDGPRARDRGRARGHPGDRRDERRAAPHAGVPGRRRSPKFTATRAAAMALRSSSRWPT